MKISILGAGAYGLALSLMFYENKNEITLWTTFEEEKKMLEEKRCHDRVLPNIQLPKELNFSTNLEETIKNSDIIVFAIPAHAFECVCKNVKKFIQNQIILIASKGIENEKLRFLHEIAEEHMNNSIAVISGPTFAIDMASKQNIALTLASKDEKAREKIKKALQNQYLKLEETEDVIGTEICGAYKNVVAIASGILDGMNVSISTKCMFLTDAFKEMETLIIALKGNKSTILSFCGFGDFILTCTSEKSRNFTLGKMIGSKEDKEKIEEYKKNTTIEGLYTLKTIEKLIKVKQISLNLIPTLSNIINEESNPESLIIQEKKSY